MKVNGLACTSAQLNQLSARLHEATSHFKL
jgi:hypothetical protein